MRVLGELRIVSLETAFVTAAITRHSFSSACSFFSETVEAHLVRYGIIVSVTERFLEHLECSLQPILG